MEHYFIFTLARYKGRKFAYILVIALFTLMHLISSIEVQSTNTVLLSPSFYLVFGSVRAIIPVAAILTLPSYLIPAGIMTYAVDKHDNLAIAIGVHVLNNILASITLAENKMKLTSKEQFSTIIAEGITLVDFYADWCNPCKMLSPILDEIESDLSGKVNVLKVDVDRFRELAEAHRVSSIPALYLFKNGKVVENVIGFQAKPKLVALIEKHL
ncbi:Thioredoxin [Holotrichia oblita]|nr:Thioredoxin [Holotrichia oblita]